MVSSRESQSCAACLSVMSRRQTLCTRMVADGKGELALCVNIARLKCYTYKADLSLPKESHQTARAHGLTAGRGPVRQGVCQNSNEARESALELKHLSDVLK